MDIRQLRYFVEIVDQGSLTAAALRLGVAQPALSVHMRNMEDTLGTELLHRSKAGVSATDAGELLYTYAKRTLAERDHVIDDIQNLASDPRGQVRVGLPGTIGSMISLPLIEEAKRLYPNIRLTISEAMSGFVGDWLREGDVDIAILYAIPSGGGLQAKILLEEELFLISRPSDAPSPSFGFEALKDMDLVLPTRSHGLRQVISEALTLGISAQNEPLEPYIEVDSFITLKALVERGYGRSVLPLAAVAQELREGRLCAWPFLHNTLSRQIHIVSRSSVQLGRSHRLIYQLICDVILGMMTERTWPGASPIHTELGAGLR